MKLYYKYVIFFMIAFMFFGAIFYYVYSYRNFLVNKEVIKVGVLFSQSGTMELTEKTIINATLLAIDEVNKSGILPGVRLEPVVYDGASNWERFAFLARKMILKDKVKVIVGCWSSSCRKAVKSVVEKYNNLLIYPTQFEGTEESHNIVYLGAAPNQQVIPGISWMFDHYGKKVYLIGSDYIYPHVANEIILADVKSLGGEIVGVKYLPLGSNDVGDVINDIIKKRPDFIVNTINGSTNIAFFTQLNALTTGIKRIPVISFSVSDAEVNKIGIDKYKGNYQVWSYFTLLDTPENKAFLKAYQKKYGNVNNISDPAITAYAGLKLWAQGLAQAITQSVDLNPNIIRGFMLRQSIASPAGVIYIDPFNAMAWRTVLISKVNDQGKMDIVWSSKSPIEPVNYMNSKTKTEWDLFEYQLYTKWNEAWENLSN